MSISFVYLYIAIYNYLSNLFSSQLNFLVPQLKVLGTQFEAYWLSEGVVAIKWEVAA